MITKTNQAIIDRWNAHHPEGTPVIYYSHPHADPARSRTRTAAYATVTGTPMVMLEGRAGGFCLTHIHATDEQGRPEVSRALSVQQPWATSQTVGPKDGENRWKRIFSPPLGGTFVAVHASIMLDREGWSFVEQLWPGSGCFRFPTGAIIGVVRYLPPDPPMSHPGRPSRWRALQQYWYPRAEALNFDQPVPCIGRLGLWRMPDVVAAAVQERIPAHWP